MAFTFSAETRVAAYALGLSAEVVAFLEQTETQARARARAMRVPSLASEYRRRAKMLDRVSRRSRMQP